MYLSLCILFSVVWIQGTVGYKERLCVNPTIENGWVEAKQNQRLDAYTAKLHCHDGFTLVGPETIKCRSGILSVNPNNFPFCTAIGSCSELPEIENGHKRSVRGYRNSVYRFGCNRGYKLYGSSTMYCTRSGWSNPNTPVCTKSGCDERLVSDVIHGRSKKVNGGGVYKFWCETGATMEGPPAVVCDGTNWNETAPLCLTPPGPPYLEMQVEGVAGTSAQAGQVVTLICQSQGGGNPTPELTFTNNGQIIGNKETGTNAYSFTMEATNDGNKFQCEALNRLLQSPISSQQIQLKFLYAPKEVKISGEDTVNPGDELTFECESDAQPLAQLVWSVRNDNGEEIDVTTDMSGAVARASFIVDESVKIYSIQCVASNGLGDATRSKDIHVRYLPENMILDGPNEVTPDTPSIFNCSTQHSYPAATLTWNVDFPEDSDLAELADNMHQDVELLLEDGSWMTSSSLTIPALDKIHSNFKVQCVASVEGLDGQKESESHSVVVTYLPSSVSISGPDDAHRGEEVEYSCDIEGGNPAPTAVIKLEDQYGSAISPSSASEHSVSVTVEDSHKALHVTCLVSNLAGEMHAEKDVSVIYGPDHVTIDGKEEVEANTEVEYICKAGASYPPPQLIWSVLDQEGHQVPISATEPESSSEGEYTSSMRMRVEDRHRHMSVMCTASNSAAQINHQLSVQVHNAPKSVAINGAEMVNDGETAVYECVSGVASPPADLTWEITDQDGQPIDVTTINAGVEEGAGWSKVSLRADKSQKIVGLKCTASNQVGSVSHIQQVYIQYAPENLKLMAPESTGASDESEVRCSSSSSVPAADIVWTFIINGQEVELDREETDQVNTLMEDGGIETYSTVKLPVTGNGDIMVRCKAVGDWPNLQQLVQEQTIKMTGPPGSPLIAGLREGAEVPLSSQHVLTCSAEAGNPPATLRWFRGQEEVKDVDMEVHGGNVIATWNYVAMVGDRQLSCEASNDVTGEPLVATINVDVNKPIEVHLEKEEQKEKEYSTINKKWSDKNYYENYDNQDPVYDDNNENEEEYDEEQEYNTIEEEYDQEHTVNKEQSKEYVQELEFNHNDENEEYVEEAEFNIEHKEEHETPIAPESNPGVPAAKSSKSFNPIAEAQYDGSYSSGIKSSEAKITSILLVLAISKFFL